MQARTDGAQSLRLSHPGVSSSLDDSSAWLQVAHDQRLSRQRKVVVNDADTIADFASRKGPE